MKRILLTILQLAVTMAMLWWVFHDPAQRGKMWEALQRANYWWVAGGVVAYLIVEASAALRWQILLLLLLFLLGTSLAGLFASFIISGFNLFRWLPHKFPGREKLIETSAAYHLYAHHWIATLMAFAASLVAHLATFTTFLCVAYGFRAGVSKIGRAHV